MRKNFKKSIKKVCNPLEFCILTLLSLIFLLLLLPASFARDIPKEGTSILQDSFVSGMLENRNCSMVSIGQKVSENPVTRQLNDQADQRLMVQMRNFECMAYAFEEVEEAIDSSNASQIQKDIARRNMATARFWWVHGARKYANDIVRVLGAPNEQFYFSSDQNYGWTYTAHGMKSLADALRTLYGNNYLDVAPISRQTWDFLRWTKSKSRGGKPEGSPVSTGQVYFKTPISQEQMMILEDIEKLHTEAAAALLCKKKTGNWCPGGRPAPVVSEEMDAKTVEGARKYGVPIMIPFAKGVDKDITYEQLCDLSQRINRAHHDWMEGVMEGNTQEGFNKAWIAMLAHSILHIERRTGDRILNDEFRLRNDYIDVPGPGVGPDGSCNLDPATSNTLVSVSASSLPDTFDRPNSTTLGNGWVEIRGDLYIGSGEVYNLRESIAVLPKISGNDQSASASFAWVRNSPSPRSGIILRLRDFKNYYVLYRQLGGSSKLVIAKVVDGKETTLKTLNSLNVAQNRYFKMEGMAIGNKLTLKIDNIERLSVTDSTFGDGMVGFMLNSENGHKLDSFTASLG